jgi:hypothetical protein
MDEADAQRFRRVEPLGGDEVAARGLLAHRANHIRADRRRQQAQARFGQAEVHASAATATSHAATRPTPPA